MISSETLNSIAEKLNQQALDDALIQTLRAEFAPIHFTYCMDDDISNANPVLSLSHCHLYLIDGREHCLCLTQDLNIATGIVVAELINDD